MIKIGFKPSMGVDALTDNPIEQFKAILNLTHAARDAGFHSLWDGQHYFAPGRVHWEATPTLARLIPEAKGMEVGTCVFLLPLHHPVIVAEQIAILDLLSEGKFIFGIALGYREREFNGFGVERKKRVSRFEESISLIKRLWTEDNVSFAGKNFRVNNLTTRTRPLQKPAPPIWIAAHADPAVERAARLGDSLIMNPHASVQTLERQLEVYRAALAKHAKPFPREISIRKDIFIARDRKTAWDEARQSTPKRIQNAIKEQQAAQLPEADGFGEENLDEFLKTRAIIGDPDDCVEQMMTYQQRLCVNHFIFRIAATTLKDGLDRIELIGRNVIGQLNKN
jgi:alkanesulfonate monooxygenase SsuD/methylene tetrahydromethanopterin reductase-like flavin-dependent oxidoreductase (luciferase family)